jgi:predicted enzyme involved in methoxymalonyl-ACP biosynthesis
VTDVEYEVMQVMNALAVAREELARATDSPGTHEAAKERVESLEEYLADLLEAREKDNGSLH